MWLLSVQYSKLEVPIFCMPGTTERAKLIFNLLILIIIYFKLVQGYKKIAFVNIYIFQKFQHDIYIYLPFLH